jgi:hypothetical protein
LKDGLVVPTPTLPPVVKIFPIVLELPSANKLLETLRVAIVLVVTFSFVTIKLAAVIPVLADNVEALTFVRVTFCKLANPVALIVPAEIFVFNIFGLVIFTVVNVPASVKLPDKLKFAPVIVVELSVPALTFVPTTLVADNKPEVTLVVEIKVPEETFVKTAFVKVDKPDMLIVPVVIPVLAIKIPTETLVAVVFARADNPDALIDPVLTLVAVVFARTEVPDALMVPVVRPILAVKVEALTFVTVAFTRVDNPVALTVPLVIPVTLILPIVPIL